MDEVVAAAPRLLSFTNRIPLQSGFTTQFSLHLDPVLAALQDVETLTLTAIGFDFSAILPLLQSHQRLRILIIADKHLPSSYQPFHDLPASAAATFITHAPALQSIALPHQLAAIWTESELAGVREAAMKRGISFCMD